VREALRLNIPVFALVDTNSDPDPIDYLIPCNDDAFKAINLVTHALADAILDGRSGRQQDEEAEKAVEVETLEAVEEE